MNQQETKTTTVEDFKRVLKEKEQYKGEVDYLKSKIAKVYAEKNALRQRLLDLTTEVDTLKKDPNFNTLNTAYESAKMTIHAQRDELLSIYRTAFTLVQRGLK